MHYETFDCTSRNPENEEIIYIQAPSWSSVCPDTFRVMDHVHDAVGEKTALVNKKAQLN